MGFAPKYLEVLGAGVWIIGLFDALQTLLGALYAYPGGWLTDRWGQRRSLLFFNALSLGGYVLVLFWQHWLALVLGAFLFLAWSALSLPATFTVVATSLESGRHTMGIGVQSMVRRVPMMLGPLAGGWSIGSAGRRAFDGRCSCAFHWRCSRRCFNGSWSNREVHLLKQRERRPPRGWRLLSR